MCSSSFSSKAKDAISGAPEHGIQEKFPCADCSSGAPDTASLAFDANEVSGITNERFCFSCLA